MTGRQSDTVTPGPGHCSNRRQLNCELQQGVKKVTLECKPSKRVDDQERLIMIWIHDRPDIGSLPDIGDNRDTQLEYRDFPDIGYYVRYRDILNISISGVSRYRVLRYPKLIPISGVTGH